MFQFDVSLTLKLVAAIFLFALCESVFILYLQILTILVEQDLLNGLKTEAELNVYLVKIELRDKISKWQFLNFTLTRINALCHRFGSKTNARNVVSKTNRQDLKARRTRRREKTLRRLHKIK